MIDPLRGPGIANLCHHSAKTVNDSLARQPGSPAFAREAPSPPYSPIPPFSGWPSWYVDNPSGVRPVVSGI